MATNAATATAQSSAREWRAWRRASGLPERWQAPRPSRRRTKPRSSACCHRRRRVPTAPAPAALRAQRTAAPRQGRPSRRAAASPNRSQAASPRDPAAALQKLNAERKRRSSSQRCSSTSSRCMSAICAAGPPNESSPILPNTAQACARMVGKRAAGRLQRDRTFPCVPPKALETALGLESLTGRPVLPRASSTRAPRSRQRAAAG